MSNYNMPDDSDSSDGEFDLPPSINNKKRQNQFLDDVENFESLGNYDEPRTQPQRQEQAKYAGRNSNNLMPYDSNQSKNDYASNQAFV